MASCGEFIPNSSSIHPVLLKDGPRKATGEQCKGGGCLCGTRRWGTEERSYHFTTGKGQTEGRDHRVAATVLPPVIGTTCRFPAASATGLSKTRYIKQLTSITVQRSCLGTESSATASKRSYDKSIHNFRCTTGIGLQTLMASSRPALWVRPTDLPVRLGSTLVSTIRRPHPFEQITPSIQTTILLILQGP